MKVIILLLLLNPFHKVHLYPFPLHLVVNHSLPFTCVALLSLSPSHCLQLKYHCLTRNHLLIQLNWRMAVYMKFHLIFRKRSFFLLLLHLRLRYSFLRDLVIVRKSCFFTMECISKDIWNGVWIITFGNLAHSSHVSAGTLSSFIALTKSWHSHNLDKDTWLAPYQEEYSGLSSNDTFDVIFEEEYWLSSYDTFDVILEEEYWRSCSIHGVTAIPSMCIFTIRHTNGIPTRAKSHIVVLGNLDQRAWSKSDCFSPVVSIRIIHLLTALAVQNNRTLKQ